MPDIKEVLIEFNPWWKGITPEIGYKERLIYKKIQHYMKYKQIIALTGLRRTGKTTLLLKCIIDAISSGFEAKNILYFSFDEFSKIEIRDIIKAYEEINLVNINNGRYMLFLDEVQKVDNWNNQVKSLYDIYSDNVKIFVSESESLFIRKRSKETLSGRIFEFRINQLSFREFLSFKGFEFEPIGLYSRELAILFNSFIRSFGFPELVGITDREAIEKYVKEGIIEKIIYKDIPQLFHLKDIGVLVSLFNIVMEEPGQFIDFSSISKELGITRQSVSNYLTYLEESFLVKKLFVGQEYHDFQVVDELHVI